LICESLCLWAGGFVPTLGIVALLPNDGEKLPLLLLIRQVVNPHNVGISDL
jgi:hypothetical protein